MLVFKHLSVTVAIALAPVPLLAQGAQMPFMVPPVILRADSMTRLLGLTPAQTARYRAIVDSGTAPRQGPLPGANGFDVTSNAFEDVVISMNSVPRQTGRPSGYQVDSAVTKIYLSNPDPKLGRRTLVINDTLHAGAGATDTAYVKTLLTRAEAMPNKSYVRGVGVDPQLIGKLRAILDDAQKVTFDQLVKVKPL